VNHHDRFFKAVFSQPKHAIDHFRRFLPAEVVAALDVDTASLVPGSFVDERLAELHTDLLFSVGLAGSANNGAEAFVYVLFEHQSSIDRAMPLRLLRYMMRIWDRWLETNGNYPHQLPPIVPLVLYHGASAWTAATSLSELFSVPPEALASLRPHLPDFQMVLNDLSQYSDAQVRDGGLAGGARLLFKHIQELADDADGSGATWMASVVVRVAAAEGLMAARLVVEYLLVAKAPEPEQLAELVKPALGSEGAKMVMSTADRLRAEGRREGRREGLVPARRLFVALAEERYGPLPTPLRQQVDEASLEALEGLTEALLRGSSLEDLLSFPDDE